MQYINEGGPMVVVEMITYNHEKYIGQAIESILMQVTNFDYKIIICEDCSTDNTAQICKEYKKKYPDKIDLYLNEKNIGVELNGRKLHQLSLSTNAKYIAMLDGDDHWTDPNKLQKQIAFLETNKDYVLSTHNVNVLFEDTGEFIKFDFPKEFIRSASNITTELIIKHWGLYTCSFVFRNGLELPNWYDEVKAGDFCIALLLSSKGKVVLFDESMAVYRKHSSGATADPHHIIPMFKNVIEMLNNFDVYTNRKFKASISRKTRVMNSTIKLFKSNNSFHAFSLTLKLALLNHPIGLASVRHAIKQYKLHKKIKNNLNKISK